jgi:hypothetical protein
MTGTVKQGGSVGKLKRNVPAQARAELGSGKTEGRSSASPAAGG